MCVCVCGMFVCVYENSCVGASVWVIVGVCLCGRMCVWVHFCAREWVRVCV